MSQHETSLHQIMEHLQQLNTSVAQLGGQLSTMKDQMLPSAMASSSFHHSPADSAASPALQAREPYIPIPARYSGDLGTCEQFLHQYSLVFSQQPNTYNTHQSKIAFVMSLLTGQAAAWSLAITTQQSGILTDYTLFTQEMKQVFDHPVKGRQAMGQLLDLQQGSESVSQYAVKFHILAAESGWGDSVLQAIFLKGLTSGMKDELTLRDESPSLNHLIDLAIRLDNRMRERSRERLENRRRPFSTGNQLRSTDSPPALRSLTDNAPEQRTEPRLPSEEPMQLGRTRLTPAERQRRMQRKLCLYCGKEGHFLKLCPEVPKAQAHR